ncbi:hypothetical protein G7054_g160 [Neopestalotiopsis clavispora]|nr:hypothetical protein G7054_g160 [Neopestalotiopsis clavispora]
MAATTARPRVIYSDNGPESPYPLRMEGTVISGFGRGSKELGIPTANLPVDSEQTPWIADSTSGVYFGYASLALPASHPDRESSPSSSDFQIYPMVMSIGYNPFYKNTVRSAEVHVLHKFAQDFYDVPMRLLILGFIREEKDYNGLEAVDRGHQHRLRRRPPELEPRGVDAQGGRRGGWQRYAGWYLARQSSMKNRGSNRLWGVKTIRETFHDECHSV